MGCATHSLCWPVLSKVGSVFLNRECSPEGRGHQNGTRTENASGRQGRRASIYMGSKGDVEPLLSEKSLPKQGTVTVWDF